MIQLFTFSHVRHYRRVHFIEWRDPSKQNGAPEHQNGSSENPRSGITTRDNQQIMNASSFSIYNSIQDQSLKDL